MKLASIFVLAVLAVTATAKEAIVAAASPALTSAPAKKPAKVSSAPVKEGDMSSDKESGDDGSEGDQSDYLRGDESQSGSDCQCEDETGYYSDASDGEMMVLAALPKKQQGGGLSDMGILPYPGSESHGRRRRRPCRRNHHHRKPCRCPVPNPNGYCPRRHPQHRGGMSGSDSEMDGKSTQAKQQAVKA